METDRYFGEDVELDHPFVRFYTWDRPTISYGRNQNIAKRIKSDLCARDGISLVMRPTGGRELLHGHDLCYSVAWPCRGQISAVDAKEYFRFINDALVAGFEKMGIEATWTRFQARPKIHGGPCFAQIDSGEITVNGKKLVGSAQRVFKQCIIQQGSIPLRRPLVDLLKYLNHDQMGYMAKAMDELTTFLYEEIGSETQLVSIVDEFRAAFEEAFGSQSLSAQIVLNEFLRRNALENAGKAIE
jgi:lipoate-protein ligase A